ncbi:restriction endonuclease subunit S [Microbulbifer sp. GL-2]|uniref:restriction endonuclease subunit S n=1 Tax=Microbulbifer sp. GL-2 TaxID=2591606 RepID=UPI001165B9BC|nr:restriction endonuclease subunit S [Microbulbifer sp. GL-2]BBM01975.1 type I restriction endonuclease EcoAI subunit S [Microbulbifer sp. GL-2]
MSAEKLITENLELWTSAVKAKKTQGRGSNSKRELYGIRKLRELILELAVRGKLVPQDPNDEPASVLLERVAAEKAQLMTGKSTKKRNSLPNISSNEEPFELPNSWSWIRFDEIVEIGSGITKGRKFAGKETVIVPYLRVANVQRSKLALEEIKEIEIAKEEIKKYQVQYGDLLITEGGDWDKVGRTAIWQVRSEYMAHQNHVFKARIIGNELDAEWLEKYLNSKPSRDYFAGSSKQTTNLASINKSQLRNTTIAIPPLNEQERIVTKVNELMALCDQLEQQTEASLDAHQQLVDTLLATLTSAQDAEELKQNWARLSEHFDTLITTDYAVEQLKQTILQLAVMGKLVPQDPNDEPASALLERIAAEKAELIKEKKIKKQKPLPKIRNEEKPFDLPRGWEWVRLEALSHLITKGSSPKWQGVAYTENSDDILFITSENVGVNKLLLDKKKYVEKKFNDLEPRSILRKGDILMNIVGGSIGRTAVYDIESLANINQAVCLIRIFDEHINKRYLLKFFNSETCRGYMFDQQVDNARANLSMGNISKFVVPVPPLHEQYRINTRVDKLISLCDLLTERLSKAQTTHLQLANTAILDATELFLR